jgi:hypothetical protein
MIKLVDKEPVYFELYEALAHFIARQQLVVRTVIEFGINPAALARGVAGWYDRVPSSYGDWGEEWTYAFHGGGCDLINKKSGEPITWNGPDPLAFGHLPFVHHLEWRLKNEDGLPHLRRFVEQNDAMRVIDLIQDLIDSGVITPERHVTPDMQPVQKNAA